MTVTVEAPTFEHHRRALGIGESRPRISWRTTAPAGWTQAAYELRVDDRHHERVTSPDSVLMPWPADELRSRQHASVCVRVTGTDGSSSDWSPVADVEAGLLRPEDWAARPVRAPWAEDADSDDRAPPLVRRDFTVRKGLEHARLYATAHGLYEVEIDGQRVGDDAMSPGW
ncbi:MAG TPA: alpha-L-rhamnosidase N-terminal domain-containing protein, partial [Lapillicoccus sp.]|uniref:glycoside hydrolase family 78 protein n=1 Tax=Lapillicoccus sp. TaxID=1909287 RepID=UPI002F94303E